MARQETILSIFVSSPSDVDEERNRLEDVIRELNVTWSRDLGIRLELIRWETHAFPRFGEDPQAVINEQIPQDFDLFIGLMWYKFGTPTGRAGSGTVEEFQRAKERYDADPDALQLMIYFKDAPAPVPPTQLDHKQMTSVSKFRSSLDKVGGLYWSFQTIDEFEGLVRLHLSRHVQAWRRSQARGGKAHSFNRRIDPSSRAGVSESADRIAPRNVFASTFSWKEAPCGFRRRSRDPSWAGILKRDGPLAPESPTGHRILPVCDFIQESGQ